MIYELVCWISAVNNDSTNVPSDGFVDWHDGVSLFVLYEYIRTLSDDPKPALAQHHVSEQTIPKHGQCQQMPETLGTWPALTWAEACQKNPLWWFSTNVGSATGQHFVPPCLETTSLRSYTKLSDVAWLVYSSLHYSNLCITIGKGYATWYSTWTNCSTT